MLRSILRVFLGSQKALSRGFDKLLPKKLRTDGNKDYIYSLAPDYVSPNTTVYDVGGGKSPLIDMETKQRMNIRLVGIDIDQSELDRASVGTYDEAICADICRYSGKGDGDLIICQAVMEHVPDVASAFKTMHSILKPGGKAVLFTPSKHAVFARMNRLLPERLKCALLYGINPHTKAMQGFPAYYDKCSPTDFRKLAEETDFEIIEERFYYISSYFSCFFPAYLLWRLWIIAGVLMFRERAAETFCVVLKKNGE